MSHRGCQESSGLILPALCHLGSELRQSLPLFSPMSPGLGISYWKWGRPVSRLVDIPSIVEKVPHFGDAGRESEECHVPSKGTKLVGMRMRMETEDVQG